MLAYNESLKQFKNDVTFNRLVSKISTNLKVGESERNAWRDASIYMKGILEISKIPEDIEIGMELKLPITDHRVDFLIAGLDDDYEKSLIIIEVKRWASVSKTDKENLVNADDTRYGQDSLHPSFQAYSYKLNLEAFSEEIVRNNISIFSCAYLHNLMDDLDIKSKFYKQLLEKSPIFCGRASDTLKLADFIKTHVSKAYKNKILYQISESKIKPTPMLMNTLSEELNNNEVFRLLDKQEICYQNIRKVIKDSERSDKKQVIIVRGGAGTGKSVIAVKILNDFIQNGKLAFYITKNSAVKNVYAKKLSGSLNAHLRSLFKSAIFISRDRPINAYECLVVDEAHRLPQRSKVGNILLGNDLIDEIIQAAKISIFFIDEKQQVDIRDYATIEKIKSIAKKNNAVVHDNVNLELTAQFRCSGNDDFIRIIDSILYNKELKQDEYTSFDIRVFDNIYDWNDAILDKIIATENSRMISGDVFDWVSKDNPSAFDIEIDGLKLQWNRDTNFVAQDVQKYRVGHIDSVQGLEFEYIGLIIGDDIIYDPIKQKVLTDYTKHPENAGHFRRHGRRNPLDSDLPAIDLIIRNTYGVLFKRGMKGCYIYCMDKNLTKYLETIFNNKR